ncbi:MAG: hypothetical protein IT428_30915, partial [Planctomycetaceae bacterium]|nr:hypothetical protein [Planctomycetaceae bacterium]
WVFFPHKVLAENLRVPILDFKVVGFGGPFLLFVMALLILHLVFPYPSSVSYYELVDLDNPTPAGTFRFAGRENHPQILLVKHPDGRGDALTGFVVKFDSNGAFKVTISNSQHFFADQEVTFKPGLMSEKITLVAPAAGAQ